MTESNTTVPELRRSILSSVEAVDVIQRPDLIVHVADLTDAAPDRVESELTELERRGEVYLVGEDAPEVRRT